MPRLYSYVLRYDDGSAPNPFWGLCTLTICKPAIRKGAQPGDWVLGTGSKAARIGGGSITADLSGSLVYAMRVHRKMTLQDYDAWCHQHLPQKIPVAGAADWRLRMGDCVYDFAAGAEAPPLRPESTQHAHNRVRDFRGMFSLHATEFYYFGEEARPLALHLLPLVKQGQGHMVTEDAALIAAFEKWIAQYQPGRIYAPPQLQWQYDGPLRNEQRKYPRAAK